MVSLPLVHKLVQSVCLLPARERTSNDRHSEIQKGLLKKCAHWWEPPREIPPMTRSCGRELLSKASGLNRRPRLSQASTPKPESVCFTISWLSPTPLTLTGGYSWPPFSGENKLRAIANKSPAHERNISNQTPSVSILACLAGICRLLQLRIWLFTASQLWEAWKT